MTESRGSVLDRLRPAPGAPFEVSGRWGSSPEIGHDDQGAGDDVGKEVGEQVGREAGDEAREEWPDDGLSFEELVAGRGPLTGPSRSSTIIDLTGAAARVVELRRVARPVPATWAPQLDRWGSSPVPDGQEVAESPTVDHECSITDELPEPAARRDAADRTDAAGAVDPRFARRREQVRQERERRRLRPVAWLMLTALVAMAGVAVLFSPFFSVREIVVVGADRSTAGLVRATSGLSAGTPMVMLRGSRAVDRVERLPWVAHVTVTRRWPRRVVVSVVERMPAAAIAVVGDRRAIVDDDGHVLAVQRSGDALPQVRIIAPLPPNAGVPPWPAPAERHLGDELLRLAMLRPIGDPGLSSVGSEPESAAITPPRLGSTVSPIARRGIDVARSFDVDVVPFVELVEVGRDTTTVVLSSPVDVQRDIRVQFGPPRADASDLSMKQRALKIVFDQLDLRRVSEIDLSVPDAPVLTRGPRP